MLSNCGAGEDSWGSLGLQRDPTRILKEISPEYSLVGLMLKLKLQYFDHLMWRADSFEKTVMLGKIESRRRRGQQRMRVGWHHWLNGHGFEQTLGVGDGQGSLVCCSRKVGHSWATELNWTDWDDCGVGKFAVSNENFSTLNYNIEGTILVLFHGFTTKPTVKIRLLD